ncbi:MAG: OmpA family protein [Prevotella sp.]|nr:OmpA family protein [Prevotella sp.]MBQ9203889.1 OmpA family protein [Prevotella sp.]
MKTKIISLLLCMGIVVSCNNTGKGMGLGAGGGALLGGAIGALAGKSVGGALIGAAIGGAVGTGAGYIIGNKMDKAKKEAEQALQQSAQVETVTDTNGLEAVKVTFDSGILFATGKADLSATAKTSLSKLSGVLKNNADCDVSIKGYTDNAGWRGATAEQSIEKNKALSVDRAASVSNYLLSLTVPASQIKSVEGLGQENPVADNSTAAGQAQNRRVEIYLYASEQMIKDAEAQAK